MVISRAYAKDRHHVFYYGEIIEDLDPNTFELLDAAYVRDKSHVFFLYDKLEVDRDSFRLLGKGYSLDKNYVYYNSNNTLEIVSDVPWSFTLVLDENKDPTFYGMDRENVYLRGKIVENANPYTFHIFSSGYACDEKSIYQFGKFIKAGVCADIPKLS